MDLVPLLGYIYIFTLVIGLTLLFLRKLPTVKPPEAILKLIDTFKPMIMSGLLAFGAFYAVIWLAKKAACQRPPGRYFESFQAKTPPQQGPTPPPGSPPSAYIPYVERALERLEANLETMSETSSDVCGIVNEIEAAYVSMKSGDVDESEFSLPRAEQDTRRQARKERATKIFANNRSLFAKRSGTPVLECWQDVGMDVTDNGEAELQTTAQELQTLLEDEEVQKVMSLYQPSINALNFAGKYLDKAIDMQEGFQGAGAPTAASISTPVGSLTGPALLKAVEKLLKQEAMFNVTLIMLKNSYTAIRTRTDEQYRKADRAERGDITSSDVQSSLRERNVAVPT